MEGPIVNLVGISKSFGPVRAVQDVDFHVGQSEIVGLVGDNGAGKSTLIKILSGVHQADKGEIYYEGEKVVISSPIEARNMGIETIYQDLALVEDLPIYRNIFLARELKNRYLGFLKLLDDKKMQVEAEKTLETLHIDCGEVDQTVRHLSGGQRQCVSLARSIYYDAKLLAMDEPTAALGVAESTEVLNLIRNLKEQGRSVIVVTHNLNHIFSVCDRISVLRRGKMVGSRYTKETTTDEITDMILGRGRFRPEAAS